MMKTLYFLCLIFIISSCSNEPASNNVLRNDKTLFLWKEQEMDDNGRSTNWMICLNQEYIDTISDEEKAALGYVATFVGNECYWDGQTNENGTNSKCKILSALDLGYECSAQHLDYLRFWFRTDSVALDKLNDCGASPNTATIQDSFDEIYISKFGKIMIVNFIASGIYLRENYTWSWEEVIIFKITNEGLKIAKTYRRDLSNKSL